MFLGHACVSAHNWSEIDDIVKWYENTQPDL